MTEVTSSSSSRQRSDTTDGVVVLVRHGRSVANGQGILAGRTAGVALDDSGNAQASELVQRLAELPVGRIVSSPLQRCRETMAPLAAARGLEMAVNNDLTEVDYGAWTNRSLAELVKEPQWVTVQRQPSAMVFPDGEALMAVSARASAAVRALAATDSGHVTVACSHGDVIKAVLADALGMHLDLFQRLTVATASVSIIRYGSAHPVVSCVGLTGAVAAPVASVSMAAAQGAVVGGP